MSVDQEIGLSENEKLRMDCARLREENAALLNQVNALLAQLDDIVEMQDYESTL